MKLALLPLLLAVCLHAVASDGISSAPAQSPLEERSGNAPLRCAENATVLACKSAQADNENVGVLLLNLGGPERVEDVQPFLYNLFADPDIIRLPWYMSWLQKPLAFVISKSRSGRSEAAYKRIGGGSPIVSYTTQQAEVLERKLKANGLDAKTFVAMRYWHPLTAEAVKQLQQARVGRLVVLPLYPQYSISTTGSSLRELAKRLPAHLVEKTTVVPYWYDRPGYVATVARLIETELAKFTPEHRSQGVHILFSAHGVPKFYVETEGDIYQRHTEDCVKRVTAMLPPDVKVHLSYQSKVGPVEWLKPYTDLTIEELAKTGVKNLIVVPISFVSEHIETLEEIDIEYQALAREHGIQQWQRAPALNLDDQFLTELGDAVLEAWKDRPVLSIEQTLIQMDTRGEAVALAATQDRWGPSLILLSVFGLSLFVAVWCRRNEEVAYVKSTKSD